MTLTFIFTRTVPTSEKKNSFEKKLYVQIDNTGQYKN